MHPVTPACPRICVDAGESDGKLLPIGPTNRFDQDIRNDRQQTRNLSGREVRFPLLRAAFHSRRTPRLIPASSARGVLAPTVRPRTTTTTADTPCRPGRIGGDRMSPDRRERFPRPRCVSPECRRCGAWAWKSLTGRSRPVQGLRGAGHFHFPPARCHLRISPVPPMESSQPAGILIRSDSRFAPRSARTCPPIPRS